MMALSGVRSSWDMFARNSDLCRFATSSCRPWSSSARKRRAFWMASADWVANVWSSSTTSDGNSPGALRFTTRPPRTGPSRRGGTGRSGGGAGRRELPGGALALPERRGPGNLEELFGEVLRRAQVEHLGVLVVLVDGAGVGARELRCPGHDRGEHRVQVQCRADGPPA